MQGPPLQRIRSKADVSVATLQVQLKLVKEMVSPPDLPCCLRFSLALNMPDSFDNAHFRKCSMVVRELQQSKNVYILFKGMYKRSDGKSMSIKRFDVGVLSPDDGDDMTVRTFTPFVEWLSTCVSNGKCKLLRFPLFLVPFDVLTQGINIIGGGVYDMNGRQYRGLNLEVSGKHAMLKSLVFVKK